MRAVRLVITVLRRYQYPFRRQWVSVPTFSLLLDHISIVNMHYQTESASSTQLSRSVQSVRMPVSPDGGTGGGGSGARGQTFVTDYTVRALTDVVYFCLSRTLYQAARSATVLERTQRDATQRIPDCESNLEQVLILSNREDAVDSVCSPSSNNNQV